MKKTLILLAALALATAGSAFAQTPDQVPAVKATGSDASQNALHLHQTAKLRQGPAQAATPTQKADRHAGKMAKELGLNADQEAKVEKLMLARQQETAALKAKYGADKKAGRTEMKAAHDRYETQLKAILTPEQYAKMGQMKAEHHDKMKDAGKMKMKAKA